VALDEETEGSTVSPDNPPDEIVVGIVHGMLNVHEQEGDKFPSPWESYPHVRVPRKVWGSSRRLRRRVEKEGG
jgi:hypothetical protein